MEKRKKRAKPKAVHSVFSLSEIGGRVSGIVGIDSSLTGFAFCRLPVPEENNPIIPQRVSTPSEWNRLRRYRYILDYLIEQTLTTDLFFMENYGFAATEHQLVYLAGLGELVRLTIAERAGIEPVMVSTGQLKKFLSGKGNLPKDEVKMHTFKRYGREFKTTDEAESYVLADMGWRCLFETPDMTSFQQEVINTIKQEWFRA